MDIAKEVRALRLPMGEYVVVGSGPLAVRGIRESQDIDLVVTQGLYNQLKTEGWKEEHFPGSQREWVLSKGAFDVAATWAVDGFDPDTAQLIAAADIIDGVTFVRLEDVVKWKSVCRRDKDLKDIDLVEAYLKSGKK